MLTIKFLMLGFPKCGQHSMITYLKARFHIWDIKSVEILWNTTALKTFEHNWATEEYQLIIVIRNVYDFIRSGYYFWKYYKTMSFENFLDFKLKKWDEDGTETVIDRADFERWIRPFYKYNPMVIDIDEMAKNPNFPHEFETEEHPPLTREQKELIREKLYRLNYT